MKKAAFLNSKHCSQSSSVGTVRTELATLSGLNPLDTRKAYEALLNFQVPGVIQPEKDLPLLLAILNSELVMREPELIVGLLANILGASNMLYESLILKYPKLQTLKKDLSYPDTVKKCLSEKQQKKIEKDVSDYLDQRLSLFLEHDGETLIPAYNEDWKYLVPLTSLLSKLPDSRKAHYIEYIADTLFAAATSDRNLRGIPDAVKLEFVTQAINPLFGKSQDSKTDAVLVKEGNQSMLKVLGNRHLSGVNGNSRNYDQLGFNMLSVPLTQPTDIESAQWEHDGRKYEATVRKRIQIPIAIEENVNQLLNHPESCKFTQENSHWNQDGVLAKQIAREPGRRSRIVVTTGGNDLVKKCEEVKARLGSKSCENIEITGHMSGGCGASQLFFVRTRDVGQNTFITEPSDQKIFQKAVNCFNDLLREGKPLIITACFSAQPRDMMEMKRVMQRPIIAAAGLCSSVGWGASSDSGWSELSSDIPPPVEIREVQ